MLDLWRQLLANFSAHPWRILPATLDLLLVVLFIWRLFLMMRGIKGLAFLNVLAVLFIIQVTSRSLPLPLLSSLLQLLGPMLLVAFPVLFQSELRRALEQLGRRTFLSRLLLGSHPLEARFITTVVQAAENLAQSRVGALIVIERDQHLGEIAASGVRLDAAISSELLRQIFANSGPLHDGAVLIEGQRIAAAGCLLPLSEAEGLYPRLGTRHRAALGLAESSDAVAVVVSEERGTLGLAADGRLTQGLSPMELSHALAELLVENGRERVLQDLRRTFWPGRPMHP
ncbi:MAG: diadenylate cyclase CdaA [Patescibacteria group bacterium]